MRIPVDADWAEFHGGHLVDSRVASDQVRALSSGEAELYGIVDGSAERNLHKTHVRRNGTKHDGSDWDVFLDGRRKDQTFTSSLVVDPGCHTWQSCSLEKSVGHWEHSRHGNQIPRWTDTSALIAKTAAQSNQLQTVPGLDRDSKRRERRWCADELYWGPQRTSRWVQLIDQVEVKWPGHLFLWFLLRSSVVVARKATAGGSDEVGKTEDSHCGMRWWGLGDCGILQAGAHDLDGRCYDDEDKPCLQRDVTEVDVSRRGAGRSCLMIVWRSYVESRVYCNAGNECQDEPTCRHTVSLLR